MSIEELLQRVITKTKDDSFQWEEVGDSYFRLVLEQGAISIKNGYNRYGNNVFVLKLYDQDTCFYSSEVMINDEPFELYRELYEEIINNRDRKTERKIDTVFGSI